MEWIINQLRVHPELAIFLTLFAGFWLGRLKIGKFSLGTVTSVLLVGVLVGQLNITVDGPEEIALEALNDAVRINFPHKKGLFIGMYRKVINKEDNVTSDKRAANQV